MKNFTNALSSVRSRETIDAELNTSKSKFYLEKTLFTNRYNIFIAHMMTSGKY